MTASTARPSLGLQLVKLALFVAVVFGAIKGTERWFFAWDGGWGGGPSLSGTWVGRLTTRTQGPREVLLDLHRVKDARGKTAWTGASITGRARVCDGRTDEVDYRVDGTPNDRHAKTISFGASPLATHGPDGLELRQMLGMWNQADSLTMVAKFQWRRGATATSSTDDPDTQYTTLLMRRGTEEDFRAQCQVMVRR